MKFVRSIAAAALFSALTTTPLLAQAAISEPAAFQALNPYLDVLNGALLRGPIGCREIPTRSKPFNSGRVVFIPSTCNGTADEQDGFIRRRELTLAIATAP